MRAVFLIIGLLSAACLPTPSERPPCVAPPVANPSPQESFAAVPPRPSTTPTIGPALRLVATTTLPGQQNARGIGLDSARGHVYVVSGEGLLVTVDTKTNAVIGSLNVGGPAEGLTVDPVTGRLYVYFTRQTSDLSAALAVIDGQANKVLTTIDPEANTPFGPGGVLVVYPKTGCVYIGDFNSAVAVVDARTNTVRGSIDIGAQPIAIAVDGEADRIFVATAGPSNGLTIIDGSTNTVLRTIFGFDTPRALAALPGTGRVYLANGMDTLTIVDSLTGKVRKTLPVMNRPEVIAVDATAGRVYVANAGAGTVSIIDVSTDDVVGTAMVALAMADAIAVDPRTGRVYIEDHFSMPRTLKVYER